MEDKRSTYKVMVGRLEKPIARPRVVYRIVLKLILEK
jgi:hypothetical protein